MKKIRKDAGISLLIEMLVVCMVFLILASMAIPNYVQITQAGSDKSARDRLLLTGRAEIEAALCSQTPGCVLNLGVSAAIPTPGVSTQQQGYVFLLVVDASAPGGWHETAMSVSPGRNFWISGDLILRCTTDGPIPTGVSATC